jgi:hypothetical protein
MTGAMFGSGWSGSGDNGFDLGISQDGQTFTLRFAEIEADVGKSPELFTARVFSAVLPIDGGSGEVTIVFSAQGYAFVTEGANAYVLLSVNGQTAVQQFSAETDDSFLQQLTITSAAASPCHLVVVAVAQRDPAYPDAVAVLRPSTVDAAIQSSK